MSKVVYMRAAQMFPPMQAVLDYGWLALLMLWSNVEK